MKKILFLSFVFVLAVVTWARATVTMTFNESFVTGGPVGGTRQDGTQVSNQYANSPYGVTWADIYTGTDFPTYTGQVVCLPGEFNGSGWTTGNTLWIYGNSTGGTGAQTATVTLSTPSDYFSMDYRRPQNTGTVEFALYLGNTLVADSGTLSYGSGDIGTWKTYSVSPGMFNKVVITESDKTNFDNFSINPVPVPPSVFLLLGGLGGLGVIKKRWFNK